METTDRTREVAKQIASLMIERRDAKAMQTTSGAYVPVRKHHTTAKHDDHTNCPLEPWQVADIIDHIEGRRSYGHYLVSAENQCRMFAYDIDLLKSGEYMDIEAERWVACSPREVYAGPESAAKADLRAQLFCMAAGLSSRASRILGIKTAVASSGGKGLHVYGFLDRGTSAAEAREVATMVLQTFASFTPSRGNNFFRHEDDYRALEIEVFPKQDSVREGDGLGNLLRLPLGFNLKTGNRGFFVKIRSNLPAAGPFIEDDPLLALTLGSSRASDIEA